MLEQNSQIPSTTIDLPQSIYDSIADAALQLQLHYVINSGTTYDVRDLQVALVRYLEGCVESLVDDLMFHTVEGDRSHAFNRSEYERQLNKLQPIEAEEAISVAA